MRVGDLLDLVGFDTSEGGSSDFRASARGWLNLLRSEAAEMGPWKSALDPNGSMETDTAHPTGIYELTGYEQIVGEWLFDQASDSPIMYDPQLTIWLYDPARRTTGPPARWADGGYTASGVRQIVLWPIPDDVRTLRFTGLRALSDLGENDENLTIDPYFGPLSRWQHAFSIGLQYHAHHRNSEQASQWRAKYADFKRAVVQRRATEGLAAGVVVSPMSPDGGRKFPGRLDPAHYDTPWR